MSTILNVIFPIYGAIAIGYAIVRIGWFSGADLRVFGRFVLNVALPALLFKAVATRPIGEILHPGYLVAFLLGSLLVIALTYAWFTLTGTDKARRAVAVMGSSCPNSGLIGYPTMLLVFPDIAGIVLALNFLVENVVLIPLCLAIMDAARGDTGQSILHHIRNILWGLATRPIVIGLFAGLAVSLLGLPVPAPVEQLSGMIAASTSAIALMIIGGSLVGLRLSGQRLYALQIAAAKLVLHPVLVALVAASLPLLGLATLPADLHAAVILSAAMPMFGIYTVFAQNVGAEGPASIAVLAATSLAFVTLSVLLLWLL